MFRETGKHCLRLNTQLIRSVRKQRILRGSNGDVRLLNEDWARSGVSADDGVSTNQPVIYIVQYKDGLQYMLFALLAHL
jgi:hypothetical protein